jgi:hypothetical protein
LVAPCSSEPVFLTTLNASGAATPEALVAVSMSRNLPRLLTIRRRDVPRYLRGSLFEPTDIAGAEHNEFAADASQRALTDQLVLVRPDDVSSP